MANMKPLEIKWQLEQAGKSQSDLARFLNMDRAAISRMLKGKRGITIDEAEKIDAFFAQFGGVKGNPESGIPGTVPEVDVRAGAGAGGLVAEDWHHDGNGNTMAVDAVKAEWGIPLAWVDHQLGVSLEALRIVEILGDSNYPTLSNGDRVFINTGHRLPSPPGLYALWDGLGVVVKRVEMIPNTDPLRLNLISDNSKHAPYEVLAEEANIIGRVCGRISTL